MSQQGYTVPVIALQQSQTAVNNGSSTMWVDTTANENYNRTFHCVVTGVGAVSATILIEVSNDGVNFITPGIATVTLSGTNVAVDGTSSAAPWAFVRANVTAISGTGASVTVLMGV